jgi:hypothetical protein
MAKKTPEQIVEEEAIGLVEQELALRQQEAELVAENPKFGEFLRQMKAYEKNSKILWSTVEEQMIKHDVKSIKGDWGSITIAERTNYTAEDIDAVPVKFIKKALDTTKIRAQSKLSGKLPRGITATSKQYLTKRIK